MTEKKEAPTGNTTPEGAEKLTKRGAEKLQAGNVTKALNCFDLAYKCAQKLGDAFLLRACAFNLGAVYVASRKPQKGVEFLEKAIPPPNTHDGHSNGDLFYNFGLAYELIGNRQESVRYFELSLEEYGKDGNQAMEAEVASKAGTLYQTIGKYQQAARAYKIAAETYGKLQDLANQGQCLCHQATALFKSRKVPDALQAADSCVIMCQNVRDEETLGKLYNELGLVYTQCSDFTRAQSCFELALPLSRGPKGDQKRQAVIMQNLGAVYNSLGDYERSLSFHETAALYHAEVHNRGAQGQCFMNLAFAHSRLGNTEGAGECYLHALQAARDSKDQHAQWQAMEGLGAVAFHDGNTPRSVHYYQMALSTLAKSAEKNPTAHDRLIGKMRDALQHQIADEDGRRSALGQYAVGRGASLDEEEKKLLTILRERNTPRRTRSLSARDEVDRKQAETDTKRAPEKSKKEKPSLSRRYSRRRSSPGKVAEGPGRRQAYFASLLRPDDDDSEDDWKKRMKKYRKRHDSENSSKHHHTSDSDKKNKPQKSKNSSDDQSSVSSNQTQKIEAEKHRENLRSIPVKKPPYRSKADTETESETALGDSTSGPRSRSASRTLSRDSSEPKHKPARSRSLSPSRSSGEELNLTETNLSQYQDQLARAMGAASATQSEAETVTEAETTTDSGAETETATEQETTSARSETGSGSGSGSDTEVEGQGVQTSTTGPPEFTAPHPPDGRKQPLVLTYEKPHDTPPGDSQEAKSVKLTLPDPSDPDYQTIRSLQRTADLRRQESTPGPSTRDRPDPSQLPGPSTRDSPDPPQLPRRNFSQLEGVFSKMSRAEQEEFLYNYSKMREEKRQNAAYTNDDDLELPVRRKGSRNTSRACVVM